MSAKKTRVSPRIRIREEDGLRTTRPKSVNDGSAAGSVTPFSDQNTLIFGDASVTFPTMLPTNHPLSDVSGINALGRVTPGRSDVHFDFATSSLAPFKEVDTSTSSSFFNDAIPGLDSSFSGPLRSRIAITIDISANEDKYVYRCPQRHINSDPDGEFTTEGTGFCYYNFVTKRWDDIGKYDPATGARTYTDQATYVTASGTPADPIPVTSGVLNYMGQFVPPSHANTRGLYEDTMTAGRKTSFEHQLAQGITKVGTPTMTFFAPAAVKYHATGSNLIMMSNYISQPFLLEKVQVNFSHVRARRTHDSSSYYDQGTLSSPGTNELHCREMDNYVVFLYRQSRNAEARFLGAVPGKRDTAQDVSSSVRFLVCSASMCFYNSPSYNSGAYCLGASVPDLGFGYHPDRFPFHTPQFKHDFMMQAVHPLTTNVPKETKYFSGSVSLQMMPTISPSGLAGSSFLPITTMSAAVVSAFGIAYSSKAGYAIENYIQHAWPGTAGSVPLGGNLGGVTGSGDFSGKETGFFSPGPGPFTGLYATAPIVMKGFAGPGYLGNGTFYTNYLNASDYYYTDGAFFYGPLLGKIMNPVSRPDPRSFNASYGPGFNTTRTSVTHNYLYAETRGASTFGETSGTPTPIVLLPGDELIIGIDAGITPFKRDSGMITGSYLRIDRGPASITLYGSQVAAGTRRANITSQNSYGESVHTSDVDTPVLDEFLLERIESTYGNYHAPLATGSFPMRGVQAAAGQPTLFPQFSGSVDWNKYPRIVTLTDDRAKPIDAGVRSRFVFRNDKFGQPSNMYAFPAHAASNIAKFALLPGAKSAGKTNAFYPVTNVFTGSTVYSGNTSLHATSSSPYVEK